MCLKKSYVIDGEKCDTDSTQNVEELERLQAVYVRLQD